MGSLLSALVGFIILRLAPIRGSQSRDMLPGATLSDAGKERWADRALGENGSSTTMRP